tara:strand:+ start:775 stop:1008 length:234 start_codon:yes stop_codon:yes gene_type:complete
MKKEIEQLFYSVKDVAAMFGATEASIRAKISRKQIPVSKFFGRVMISKQWINKTVRQLEEEQASLYISDDVGTFLDS